ncbi:MAG: hypothetical protein FJ041_06250, partial [Candidatus Cloacimonetes bacterium]|nr:hypothetical protein [Candidatus Cloacimonadota bacterium]
MPIGTLISLAFSATAGIYSVDYNTTYEVGAPIIITIGSGISTQRYPLERYYNYSTHESIYLASEIGTAGSIKSIAFYKASGSDLNPISAVNIYMKNTSSATLSNGSYSLDGYTQVYTGVFPNTATTGWMEVNLDTYFQHNGISNLSILIIKGYQAYINTTVCPNWNYTNAGSNRARRAAIDSSQPTSLTASTNLPNIKLRVFPITGILYPPQNLVAFSRNLAVRLEWETPLSGNPSSYKVFRNSILHTTVSGLAYTDYTVSNDSTYSYFIKAVYTSIPSGESEPSNTVTATPSATPIITIGTGTSTQRQPFGIYYGFERDAALYLSNEINVTGSITHLQWYVGTSQASPVPVNIRMKTTESTSLTASTWASLITDAVTVYSNAGLSFASIGWHSVALSTPINYTTGNLLVLIETNYGGAGTSAYPYFRYTVSGNGTHQYWNQDNSAPLGNGIVNANRPNIRLNFQAPAPVPVFSLNPDSLGFGNVLIGMTSTESFSISNTGEGFLSGTITTPAGYTVSQARNNNYIQNTKARIASRNEISYSILSGQTENYSLLFVPLTAQSYNGNVQITSNDSQHLSNFLELTGNGVTPVFNPPVSLVSTSGNATVSLQWTAPIGGDGSLLGYKIYRNSSLITPAIITTTYYNDNTVINEVSYQYYATAVYDLPTGESIASNTADATPSAIYPIDVIIGTGNSFTLNNYVSPINISFRSVHGQSVYTAAEINSAGITGPIYITRIGFYINTAPSLSLPNFIIRMKHSSNINAANWHTADSLITVYSNSSYMPVPGGYEMLTLSTPFLWNGTDNIVLDTAFSLVNNWSNTGTLKYSTVTSGFRAARTDT